MDALKNLRVGSRLGLAFAVLLALLLAMAGVGALLTKSLNHYVEYYPGEFAEKARFYLAHPALAEKLRQNARSIIAEHHTWRHRALKFARDLEAL